MSLPALYVGRRKSWFVAVFFLLFAGLVIGIVPEAERNASPTDSIAQGFDSTKVVELSQQFPQEGDATALILWTSSDGKLTAEQIAAARTSLFKRLPAEAGPGTAGPPPGVGGGGGGGGAAGCLHCPS